jgi:hypothetical protein
MTFWLVAAQRWCKGAACIPLDLAEDVIAVGFPKVAVSTDHTLLAHKGEINGTIRNRHDGNDYLAMLDLPVWLPRLRFDAAGHLVGCCGRRPVDAAQEIKLTSRTAKLGQALPPHP